MILSEAIKYATEFTVAEDLTIQKRSDYRWCVKYMDSVLDRDLNRHYEPMPSNRTEEFITSTRFTLDEAFVIAFKYLEKIKEVVADEPVNPALLGWFGPPEPPRYSIEPHGEGYALYYGRCSHRHGYNLVHLVEPAINFDPSHIERLINLGMAEYWRNPTGGEIAE